jgi:hypothetical protein
MLVPCIFGKDLSSGLSVGSGLTVTSQKYIVYEIDSLELFEKDTFSISDEYRVFLESKLSLPLENWKLDNNLYASMSNKSFTLREKISANAIINQFRLSARDNIEVRLFDSGKSKSQSYLKNNLYLKGRTTLKQSSPIGLSLGSSMENKVFSKESSTGLNYNIFRVLPSLDYDNIVSIEYALFYRNVPDSSKAEYLQNSFNLFADHYIGYLSRLSGTIYYDIRDYPEDTLTGYRRFYSELSYEFPIASSFYIKPYYEYENYMYDYPNFIRVDYNHHTAKTMFLLRKSNKTLSYDLGAGFEYLYAKADSTIDGETYSEFSVPLSFMLMKTRFYFIQANCAIGQRFYKDWEDTTETSYYTSSDYSFVTADLILNYNITQNLRLSLIGSVSPEWHKVSADDFSLTFISASLKYTF